MILDRFNNFMNKHKQGIKYGYERANMEVLFWLHKLRYINYYVEE